VPPTWQVASLKFKVIKHTLNMGYVFVFFGLMHKGINSMYLFEFIINYDIIKGKS